MSTVALERQYRWKPNLQDLGSRLQPPGSLSRPTCIFNYPRPSANSISAAHIVGPQNPTTSVFSHSFQSQSPLQSHTQSLYHPSPSALISRPSLVTQHSATQPLHKPRLALGMHAQDASAGLAVGTIEDLVSARKLSSEALAPDLDYALNGFSSGPRQTTCSLINTTTTTASCRDGETIYTTASTTTPVANFSASAKESTESSDENPSSYCCRGRSYGKCSRSIVTTKNKGGCPRRRLIDEDGYIRRAACVCVNKEETQVLLVSSKKDPCVWLVPGGGLEAGEDAVSAAKREAWEEAGILGHIARYLGLFESFHHSGVKKHRTAVYIFIVTEEHADFPEASLGRRRQWFSTEEALLHLARHRPLQSAYLQFLLMSKLKVAAAS
ncbi:uncharacterized protein [Procambarus clarkii]|uniref:uncharacterized protein isoform X1 n=1 Tax=Procambarus clarkii TaxID=6728 RepID=UPI0037436E98